MKLWLLENESSVAGLEAAGRLEPGDPIVCFNYLVYARLRRQPGRHRVAFCEDFLSREDYAELHGATDRMALDWFRDAAEDATAFAGISYGELVKNMFSRSYMLSILVKYGEIIRRSAERWPECSEWACDFAGAGVSVWSWTDDEARLFDKARLAEEVGRQLGRSVRRFEPPRPLAVACSGRRYPAPGGGALRRLAPVIEGALNLVGSLARLFGRRRPGTYFFPYTNLSSMIGDLPRGFVLSGLSRGTIRPVALLSGVYFSDFRRLPHSFTEDERAFLDRLRARFGARGCEPAPDIFLYNGIDYGPFYRPAIADIVGTAVPRLLRRVGQFSRGFREHRIARVIVNTTMDEEMRAVLALCARDGIESIFVDHGLVGHAVAQRASEPAAPSLVITPGEYDPYGSATRRLALGNPSLDPYASRRRRAVSEIRRVMLLSFEDNYYSRLDRFAYQEKYYEEIFAALPALRALGVEVFYKPHPSESRAYHEELFRFFAVKPDSLHYVQDESFAALAPRMDLIVSNVSSCFFESLAARVPAVFLEPAFIAEAVCAPLNGVHGEDVLRLQTGSELVELVRKYHRDARPLDEFVTRFLERDARRYMGLLDGAAGRRIVEAVAETR